MVQLKNLTNLNVSHNRLEVLPLGLGVSKGSKRVVNLLASCNKISRLSSSELTALKDLQILDLSNNNIASIPAELIRFITRHTKEYCFHGNPIAMTNQFPTLFSLCRHEKSFVHPSLPRNNTRVSVENTMMTSKSKSTMKTEISCVQSESKESPDETFPPPPVTSPPPAPPPLPSPTIEAEYASHIEFATTSSKGFREGLKCTSETTHYSRISSRCGSKPRSRTMSPMDARLHDAVTRIVKVGSAGGAFRIEFGSDDCEDVQSLTTAEAKNMPTDSPNQVKLLVPPQALAHTSKIVLRYLLVDDLDLAEIADEQTLSHVVAFSPVLFMRASKLFSTSENATPIPVRLYEDLTVTLNLPQHAEMAVARRACNVHVVDVLVVGGNAMEAPGSMPRIVCAPHPKARMSSVGPQVVVKFGHLGNGFVMFFHFL